MVFTGIDPTQTTTNAVLHRDVIEGRYLSANDGYVALVDKEYADLNNLTLGSTVSYAANYTVVGIVDVSVTNIIKSHIYVNLPIVQEVLPEKPVGLVNMALIRTTSPSNVKQVSAALKEQWTNSSTLTGTDLAETAFGVIRIGEETAWSISLALVFITILFAVKTQLSNVAERTHEIGILKAIGWSNGNVVNQIVVESVIQGVIGGALGCVVGYVCAVIVLSTIGGEVGGALNLVPIDPLLLVVGFTIALLSAVVAGLFSSWRAARLSPVEAIRTT
jgi:ABC-type lipoprotein release transport system permease subunit